MAPVVVQHTSKNVTFTSLATNTTTAVFGSSITAGNTILVFIGLNMGAASLSSSFITTNGAADNWTFPVYEAFYDNIGLSGVAWDPVAAGGTATLDFSFTQSGAASTTETTSVLIDAFEISGLGPNPGIDASVANSNGGASTTSWTSTSTPGDPAGVNSAIFLGSVCLYIDAANTTSTVTGPGGGWTNETLLSSSIQQGGTGTGNKFFVYQLSGYQAFSSSPGTLVYSGTNSAAADADGCWAVSLYNGEIPFTTPDHPARAKLPHPPRGAGSIRGQVQSYKAPILPRTYYVSPAGSDSNSGLSSSTPWQTVAKVNSTVLHPGDTVLFQGGQTFSGTMLQPGQAGTAALPITFGSYGTGQATITNSSDSAIYVYEAGGVTVENLVIPGPGAATAGAGGYVGVFFNRDLAGYAPPIAVTGCTITGWADGILAGAADAGGGYSGITFTGNSVSANRDAGINVYGSGYSHENVVITGNSAFSQTGYSGNTTTSSGHGIVVGNASGGTISQNVTYGNGASCGCTSAGPVGNWAYSSQNLVIEYNVSYGNLTATPGNADGDGFDLDDQCVNCTLQYNIAYENDGFGIACYSDDSTWSGNVIRYNVTWGNSVTNPDAAEIALTGGAFANCDVYGNTFIGQTNAELPSVVLLYGASFTSVNFWNNIFYTAASGVALMYADTAYTGVAFQGNLYYSAAPFSISWGGTGYSSLAAWRTGTSQEILSGHNTGRQANPQFNAPATAPAVTSPSNLAPAHGLQLAPGSPAAAQGLNLSADFSVTPGTQDFFGNTLAYPLWAGAYQGLLIPPAGIPARAKLPKQPFLKGRVTPGNKGAPVHNPVPPTPGPVFYEPKSIRAKYPNHVYVLGNPGLIYVTGDNNPG
jgi:hypothetical protein